MMKLELTHARIMSGFFVNVNEFCSAWLAFIGDFEAVGCGFAEFFLLAGDAPGVFVREIDQEFVPGCVRAEGD